MDSTDPTNAPRSKRELAALALILALSFALRMVFVHDPFDRDEGTYAYIGQEILHGGIPYRDAIEIKPPGIMYIYAGMIALVGPSVEGIRILTAVYTLATVTAVYAVARFAFGARAGLVAALLYAVYSGTPLFQGSGSNTEVFLNLPVLASLLAFLHWHASGRRLHLIAAGALIGVAFLVKSTVLPVALLLGAVIPFVSRRRGVVRVVGDIVAFAAPTALLYAALVAWLAANGAYQPFKYWTFTFLRRYGAVGRGRWINGFQLEFTLNFAEHLLLWLAALPTAMWLVLRERSSAGRLLAAFIPAQVIAVSLPGHFHRHYFIQIVPALALAAGVGIALLWERRRALRPLLAAGAALAFGLSAWMDRAFYFELTPDEVCLAKFPGQGELFVQAPAVGAWIRERTSPTDRIFQWGWEAEVYFYADRRAANPYGAALLVGWDRDRDVALATVKKSIFTQRPVYVVFDMDSLIVWGGHELYNLVQFHYKREKRIGKFELWRRADA